MKTADEAHMPHETEVKEWVRGLHADPLHTLAHIPQRMFHLICDLGYYDLSVTPAGLELLTE